MEPVLTDKNQYPSKEVIYSHLGKTRPLWDSVFDYIHSDHPSFAEQWRYYNDGKSWLLKVTHKSKTIFWLTVIKNSFRITLYFTDRAGDAILSSLISEELKKQFNEGKHFGRIRGITIIFKNKRDISYLKSLVEIKLRVK
jgi:hypothetical protein